MYPIPAVVNPIRTLVGLVCVSVKSSMTQVAGVPEVAGQGVPAGTKIEVTSNVKGPGLGEFNVMNAVPPL